MRCGSDCGLKIGGESAVSIRKEMVGTRRLELLTSTVSNLGPESEVRYRRRASDTESQYSCALFAHPAIGT